jgi:hypothetical protein
MKIPFISPMFSPSDEERAQAMEYSEQMGQQSEFQKYQKYQLTTMRKALGSMGDENFCCQIMKKMSKVKYKQKGNPS